MLGKSAVVFVIAVTVCVVDAKVLSFSAEREIVREGDPIVLICTYDVTFEDIQRINKFNGNKTIHLSTGDQSDEEEDVPRYNVNATKANNVVTLTFTIFRASLGDAGNYSCTLYTKPQPDSKSVIIYVENEPDTIKLYLDDEDYSNSTNQVQLKLLKAYRLRCETTGSNPGANISISYGSMNLSLTNITYGNATYRFDQKDKSHEYMVPIERKTTALVDRWVLDDYWPELGSAVVCRAKVGKDAAGISTSFSPALTDGTPVFECNDTVYAKDKQKNVVITCQVFAKPFLTKARFFFNDGKSNITIGGYPFNTTRREGMYQGVVQTITNIRSSMTLTVDSVNLTAKTRFNFEAENMQGPVIHSVIVTDPAFVSLGSSVQSASLIISLFSLATVLFVQH